MLNISQLTSKKTKIVYVVIYSIYTILYIINPLLIMNFIDSIVDRNVYWIILYSLLCLLNFVLIQLVSYFFSLQVGKVEMENYVNFFSRINTITAHQDTNKNRIELSELSQYIGQYYEKSNPYFFIQKVECIYSIINVVVIFTIMFLIDWRIACVLFVFVPMSFYISKRYEKKLYDNSDQNIKNMDKVKKYIIDQNILNKEERFADYKQLNGISKFLNIFKDGYKKNVKTKSTYLYFFSYSFLNLAILIVILLSGYLTYQNILTIGTLFALQNYTSQLWTPGEFLMSYNSKYQEAKPIPSKINKLLSFKMVDYKKAKIRNIILNQYSALDVNGKQLFHPLTYNFEKGEIYLIEGDNGIGKTTLIESILGLSSRYKGEILVNNSRDKFDDFIYVPSDAYISEFYNQELSKGSSGQKKLSQLNFYLKTNKTVNILDEPTNFVDDINKNIIYETVKSLKGKKKIIIIISHDKEFEKLATKIIKLNSFAN